MRLVHLTIHPQLQEAFNLKTKMDMNMGMMGEQMDMGGETDIT